MSEEHDKPRFAGVEEALADLRAGRVVVVLDDEDRENEAAPVGRHEIDDLRRDEFRGAREVALIFAVLVVQHDDDPAGAEIR